MNNGLQQHGKAESQTGESGGIAYLFPGQGAQYVGMGNDLCEHSAAARMVFERADAALGFNLSELCFSGRLEDLNTTANTQPAILATSVAVLAAMEEAGLPKPDVAAGLSLGEYTALVAAEALSFEAALRLVRRRGELMETAVPDGQGAMAAVLGLPAAEVKAICRENAGEYVLEAVNFNCPGQVVVAGHRTAVEGSVEKFRAAGAKRVLLLAVSGPFHTSLMRPAAERLAEELAGIAWQEPKFTVLSNVDAGPMTGSGGDAISEKLIKQVCQPVLWEDIIRRMGDGGIRNFVEVGPGKTLSALVRKIHPSGVGVLNVENMESLTKLLESYQEVC